MNYNFISWDAKWHISAWEDNYTLLYMHYRMYNNFRRWKAKQHISTWQSKQLFSALAPQYVQQS
jgi:hypothetical protein